MYNTNACASVSECVQRFPMSSWLCFSPWRSGLLWLRRCIPPAEAASVRLVCKPDDEAVTAPKLNCVVISQFLGPRDGEGIISADKCQKADKLPRRGRRCTLGILPSVVPTADALNLGFSGEDGNGRQVVPDGSALFSFKLGRLLRLANLLNASIQTQP